MEEKTIEIPEMKRNFTFKVWDAPNIYRTYFLKYGKIVVLVYDITKRLSYDVMKDDCYSKLKDYCDSNIVIGIAGNKSDLYDKEVVSEQEARDFAKSIGAAFGYTSAKENSGINELFKELAKKYISGDYSYIKETEPLEVKNNNIVISKNNNRQKQCCC